MFYSWITASGAVPELDERAVDDLRVDGSELSVHGAGLICRHTDHHGQLGGSPAQQHQDGAGQDPESTLDVQGYLAHKKQPPPPGPSQGPKHELTVGSWGGVVSSERFTPVAVYR